MTAGLKGAWCFPGGCGQDLIGTNNLTPGGAVTYDGARGLVTESAGLYYQCAINPALKLQPPLTVVWQGSFPNAGSRTASAAIFGVTFTNADTTPFAAYQLGFDASGNLVFNKNEGGAFGQWSFSDSVPHAGTTTWLAVTVNTVNSISYVNDPAANPSGHGGESAINYGSTPLLSFGSPSYVSRNSLCSHEYGLIYNQSLPLKNLQWLYTNGRDLFSRPRGRIGWTAALAGATGSIVMASITANPGSIKVSTTQTITIAGTGTTFTTTAPVFSIAGVAGVSITGGSLAVIDNTHATIQIVSGTTRGTATITDATSGATASLRIGKRLTPLWAPHRPYR
jgi:hypothetical protein